MMPALPGVPDETRLRIKIDKKPLTRYFSQVLIGIVDRNMRNNYVFGIVALNAWNGG
jgi:hypothetical protein